MVPCFLNLTLQPAVLSPQRSVASLLPYFSFFKLFSFTYLRTLPSSVSRKSRVCHSYENCRGVYQQFPIWNVPRPCRGTRPCRNPSILHFRLCELCLSADSVLIPGSPHSPLFTDHCPLSPIPFLFTFLRTLLHCAKPYLLSFHAILDSSHKTPGGGGGSITKTKRKTAPSRPGRDKFRLPLQGDSQENEGCRRYGAARRGRRKRKKVSGLESRQT